MLWRLYGAGCVVSIYGAEVLWRCLWRCLYIYLEKWGKMGKNGEKWGKMVRKKLTLAYLVLIVGVELCLVVC